MALAAGAGLRLVAMIGYPGALWFAGDSYVYLGAALRPQPNLSKTTGYSVFLHALEPFHSLTLVAGLQHLMGLAVAVMIYLLLRRNGVSQRWATAATLPVLLDGFVIEDEHMVMAEALFTFLVMRVHAAHPVARYLFPAGPVAGRAAGGPAGRVRRRRAQRGPAGAAHVPGRAAGPRPAPGRRLALAELAAWLAAAAMAVGCAAPVAAYAGWFHSWWGSYTLSRAEGFYLWGRVSSFAECSGDQAASQRAGDLPVGNAVQPDAAR